MRVGWGGVGWVYASVRVEIKGQYLVPFLAVYQASWPMSLWGFPDSAPHLTTECWDYRPWLLCSALHGFWVSGLRSSQWYSNSFSYQAISQAPKAIRCGNLLFPRKLVDGGQFLSGKQCKVNIRVKTLNGTSEVILKRLSISWLPT